MSQEQNTDTSPEQQGKSAPYKRSARNGRNRPILITGNETGDQGTDMLVQEDTIERVATTATAPTVTQEAPATKNRPSFFSTIGIGKKEESADAAAARLARATRNKAATASKKEISEVKESKRAEPKAVAKSAPQRAGAAPRRAGGFKPRHLIGIILYLVVADFVGVLEKSWLGKADKLLFSLGPLPIYTSTILFLLTLVILLIVLARLDLVPRSLTPASRAPAPTSKNQSQNNSGANSESARNAPIMKQGVKGKNDDLYQEYRESERYWKRRDRKK